MIQSLLISSPETFKAEENDFLKLQTSFMLLGCKSCNNVQNDRVSFFDIQTGQSYEMVWDQSHSNLLETCFFLLEKIAPLHSCCTSGKFYI